MFTLALLIGIYSYLIFGLGLLGLLYKLYIVLVTVVYVVIVIYFNRKILNTTILQYFNVLKKASRIVKRRPFLNFLIILIFLQAVVNFIGVLGPELGFDALWYHLSLPKIYLMSHSIDYIPGGLFYYSAMPKFTEMLYVVGLSLGGEIFAKLIHFSFGILCLIAIYKIARKFLSKNFSLLVLVLFYSNLVVGWISTTGYIDLARTFFEIMALWGFLQWQEMKKQKWLIVSAVMLGLAVSTKLLAIGSLLIFSVLIIVYFLHKKRGIKNLLIGLFFYWFICLFIPLPWLMFSFIHAGNPVYPFFTNIYPVKLNLNFINPLNLSDPISPLYVILLPIYFLFFTKLELRLRIISLYSLLAFLVWQITPNIGGGRFVLPYLPAFSILTVGVIGAIKEVKTRCVFVVLIVFFSLLSTLYRFGANLKYLPVIIGTQSKSDFLRSHLNFSFGDFYDTDGYFAKKIKTEDTVLLYGFHNLYYVNFPFIDSSYVKKGDMFNYIAVQGDNLPERFKIFSLIYYNDKTNVKLYSAGHSTLRDESSGSDSKRGLKWIY